MSTHRANRITSPRLLTAMRDPGLEMIVEAARSMPATGHRRANLIAESGARVVWARAYLAFIDESILYGVADVDVLRFIETVAESARQKVYAGTGTPTESVGAALAMESTAEGDANRDTALLLDAPKCPSRLRALFNSLTFHQTRIDHARRVVAREMVARSQ